MKPKMLKLCARSVLHYYYSAIIILCAWCVVTPVLTSYLCGCVTGGKDAHSTRGVFGSRAARD